MLVCPAPSLRRSRCDGLCPDSICCAFTPSESGDSTRAQAGLAALSVWLARSRTQRASSLELASASGKP